MEAKQSFQFLLSRNVVLLLWQLIWNTLFMAATSKHPWNLCESIIQIMCILYKWYLLLKLSGLLLTWYLIKYQLKTYLQFHLLTFGKKHTSY